MDVVRILDLGVRLQASGFSEIGGLGTNLIHR
jgi:hypothetical protein